MEAAILLLLVSFIELALSCWLVARHLEYLRRIKRVEKKLEGLQIEEGASKPSDYELVKVDGATDEDMAQASAILDAIMKASKNV